MKNSLFVFFFCLFLVSIQAQTNYSVSDFNGKSMLTVTNFTDNRTKISYNIQDADLSIFKSLNPIAINQIVGLSPAFRTRVKVYPNDTKPDTLKQLIVNKTIVITHFVSGVTGMQFYVIDLHDNNLPWQHPVMVRPTNQDTLHLYFHKELGIYDYCNEALLATFEGARFTESKQFSHYSKTTASDSMLDRVFNGFMLYKDRENCQQYLLLSFSDRLSTPNPLNVISTNEMTFKITRFGDVLSRFKQSSLEKVSTPLFKPVVERKVSNVPYSANK